MQPFVFITAADLTHRLGAEPDIGGDFGGGFAVVQLTEGQSTDHHPNRLNSTTQHTVQLVPVALGQTHV